MTGLFSEMKSTMKNIGLVIALATGSVAVASPVHAGIKVTRAEIARGKLQVEGSVSAGSQVTLDGKFSTPVNGLFGFAFSLDHVPADCIVDLAVPGTSMTYKAVIANCSAKGLNAKGAWSAAATYIENDVVTHGGAAWRALAGPTANINVPPSALSSQHWQLFAALGETGSQGPKGPRGPQGEKGDEGDVGDSPQGPAGPKGATGPQGDQGIMGEVGRFGRSGRDGQDGRDGKDGPPGPQGPDGPTGNPGEAALYVERSTAPSTAAGGPGMFLEFQPATTLLVSDGQKILAPWGVYVSGIAKNPGGVAGGAFYLCAMHGTTIYRLSPDQSFSVLPAPSETGLLIAFPPSAGTLTDAALANSAVHLGLCDDNTGLEYSLSNDPALFQVAN